MDSLNEEVLKLIEFIRIKMKEMGLDSEEVFLNGNCGDLYKIFVNLFSKYTTPFLITYDKKPYHIVTRISDKLYDITGETDLYKYIQYLKENNKNRNFDDDKFMIQQVSVADNILHKMCGMYRYNENFEESEISNEMRNLLLLINKEFGKTRNEP